MNKSAYFPGCSLKDEAGDYERSAAAVMAALGQPLEELERWTCCGTVYSLTDDDLMHQLASVRNLIRAQECGAEEIVTLCSMCFNTLKRSKVFIEQDAAKLETVNAFMDEEPDYEGGVGVVHLLEILRDQVGFESIEGRVTRPLSGLRVAPYYGCTLLRPREIGIDEPDTPTILQDFIRTLCATPVEFAFQAECCGTYQIVDAPELVLEKSHRILNSAMRAGAEVMVTSCPLCMHNLRLCYEELRNSLPEERELSIVYWTQLAAIALEVETGELPTSMGKLLEGLPTSMELVP